jgi:hypothetical protein
MVFGVSSSYGLPVVEGDDIYTTPGRNYPIGDPIGSDEFRQNPWYRIPVEKCRNNRDSCRNSGHSDTFRHPTTSDRNPMFSL